MRLGPSLLTIVAVVGCSNDIAVKQSANTAPATTINDPVDGAQFIEGEIINFVGLVVDADGIDDVVSTQWSSTLDGVVADSTDAAPDSEGYSRVTVILTPGTHGIEFSATDSAGETATASIQVLIGAQLDAPEVAISTPENFQEFVQGTPVDLIGAVGDGQQDPETLQVLWTVTDNTTSTVEEVSTDPADASGITTTVWTAPARGDYIIGLTAIDDDGNSVTEEVFVTVDDPAFLDLDNDGVTQANGDCNDEDPTVSPLLDETCGDLTDNDCNNEVDDKDLDNDGVVDEECVNYTGPLPADDCNDDDSSIFPGAPEVADKKDNDCDGEADNGGPNYDDDGDCFCEVGPCVGGTGTCPGGIEEGDCVDTDAAIHPDASDVPDEDYIDSNCDDIDGDLLDAVFVDPENGANNATGLDPSDPLRDLADALDVAENEGRDWVLISNGVVSFRGGSDQFTEGISLAGGYDAGANWSRDPTDAPQIQVPASGRVISGWSDYTEWQQLDIIADDASGTGASSIALTVTNSDNLAIIDCRIEAGDGDDGSDGGNGSTGDRGDDGGTGDSADDETSGFLGFGCDGPNPQTQGGAGGLSDGVRTGGNGGRGRSNTGNPNSTDGDAGVGPGGGTSGPRSTNSDGSPGGDGSQGAAGTPGLAGAAIFTGLMGRLVANGSRLHRVFELVAEEQLDEAKRLADLDSATLVKYHRGGPTPMTPYASVETPSLTQQQTDPALALLGWQNRIRQRGANDPGFYYLWLPPSSLGIE